MIEFPLLPGTALPASLRRFGNEITIREGRAFHYQDDPCISACFLLQGSVRPVKFASDGKPFDLLPVVAGQWIGLAELLTGSTCLFDAVAVEECRALSFSGANMIRAMEEPDAAGYVIEVLAREIIWTHRILADDDAMGKLLSFLLSRRMGPNGGMERSCLRTTQNAVADALGLTRETVNRLLRELESSGLVTTARGEIGIPEWAALQDFAAARSR